MSAAPARAPSPMSAAWSSLTERVRAASAERGLRWLAAILLLAAALRIAWVLYAAREPQGLHDPFAFDVLAREFAAGHGYHYPSGPEAIYPPGPTAYYPVGYPATLGALYFLVKHTFIPNNLVLANAFLQVFCSVATVALTYAVARRLFDTTVGLVAAAWLAFFPNLIYHTANYLTETLFMFLVMLSLVLLFGARWQARLITWWRLIAFGVVLAASAYVRPISVLILPALLVALLAGGFGWRRSLGYAGAALVVTAALIAPWTLRNIVVMDSPAIISTNVGDDLCIGHHPRAPGHFALPPVCFPGNGPTERPELETERNDDNVRRALTFMRENPWFTLRNLSHKAYYTWEHDHDGIIAVESYGDDGFLEPGMRRFLTKSADLFFYFTISVGALGLAGLVMRPLDPRRLLFLMTLLAFAGVPLIFFGDSRFHVPVLPFLAVSASWLVVTAGGLAVRFAREGAAEASRPARRQAGVGTPGGTFAARGRSDVEVAERETAVADEDALHDADADHERD
jgi:hypothetical protein